jgi:hypothetical protein
MDESSRSLFEKYDPSIPREELRKITHNFRDGNGLTEYETGLITTEL